MLDRNKINNFLKRTLLAFIMFFFFCFLFDNNYLSKDIIYDNMIDFSYIRSKSNILLGKLINKKDTFVSSEKIKYKSIKKYQNSYKLEVGNNYVIKTIENGVVTFIGEKDDLGNTIIINCDDGTNIWYSNLDNISVNLYDYLSKDTIIASSQSNYIYLTFEKDNEYKSYEEYI